MNIDPKVIESIKKGNNCAQTIYYCFQEKHNHSDDQINSLTKSKYGGMVLDDDYPEGSQSVIASYLSQASDKVVGPATTA